MKANNSKLTFLIRLIFTIILLTLCFILFDLYTPIKEFIGGNEISLKYLISSINILDELPIIIGASVAIEIVNQRRLRKVKS
ncbi:hypothetical protein [Plebeiibacterium sediminum]|uniref:Uncharacterized protein n=1 Tax=Plebeiibacterium sediminum TaxID=2992112 RepID=A0AAE3SFF6_9BACT|nr:hypothetical protein [Plebeiobacterium sediminum]MCW3787440.1 hypothetical protein [Plebeiobacterium sediminum]